MVVLHNSQIGNIGVLCNCNVNFNVGAFGELSDEVRLMHACFGRYDLLNRLASPLYINLNPAPALNTPEVNLSRC